MQTLSYGFKKPQNDDTGDVFWPALSANWQLVNDHTHDGVNTPLVAVATQSLLSASWSADLGGGLYRQLVTLAGGRTFDGTSIEIRLSSGHVIFPTIEKVSSTTFYVYVNDNSLNLTAVYST